MSCETSIVLRWYYTQCFIYNTKENSPTPKPGMVYCTDTQGKHVNQPNSLEHKLYFWALGEPQYTQGSQSVDSRQMSGLQHHLGVLRPLEGDHYASVLWRTLQTIEYLYCRRGNKWEDVSKSNLRRAVTKHHSRMKPWTCTQNEKTTGGPMNDTLMCCGKTNVVRRNEELNRRPFTRGRDEKIRPRLCLTFPSVL